MAVAEQISRAGERGGLRMSGKLGEILLKENLITSDQLKQALDHQKTNGGRLGNSLVKLGFLNDDEVTAVLSRQYGVPSINLAYFEVDPNVTKLIPMDTATKYQVLPLSRVGSSLTLAMVDPTNVFAMDDIKFMTGFNIEPVVASEAAITEAIRKQYGSVEEAERKKELEEIVSFIDEGQTETLELQADDEGALNLEQLEKAAEEAPVIKLVNYILTDAVKRGASDIHMEPYEKEYRIRYRIDGILQNMMNPPFKLRDADHQPRQDHGEAGHLRKAPAPGRPHHDQDDEGRQEEGARLSRFGASHPARRKNRHAVAGQGKPPPRHD